MCGRAYSTYTDEELEIRYASRRPAYLRIIANYNLAPTQIAPIIRVKDGQRVIETAKWGLTPFKPRPGEKTAFAPINAKAETVDEKPMFKHSFAKRRCIVPVSGFYEWQKLEKSKHPHAIHLKDNDIMSLAGIYSEIALDNGEVLDTFAILTTEANGMMMDIHDRMPVILRKEDEALWLDPNADPKKIKALLKPFDEKKMIAYEIDQAVGNVRNNTPDLLRPVTA